METTTTAPMKFETETCTRCHGSGQFSRCQQYGTTCFRCRGRKITLTARGAAASTYLTALRSKPAGEVKVGDAIMNRDTGKFSPVTAIGPYPYASYSVVNGVKIEHAMIRIEAAAGGLICEPSTPVRIRQNAEQSEATFAAAIAYQATLTKTGKVRAK